PQHDFACRPASSERRVGSQTKVSVGHPRYGEQPNASMRGQNHRMSCINLRTIEMLAPECPNRGRGEGDSSPREPGNEIRVGERQDAPSREFLRAVLRGNRRKLSARACHAALLLQLPVLSRSVQARHVGTQRTGEGIMTIRENANRPARDVVRSRQVCDHCGGPFGMVTHRWWGSKFCKRRCKDAYLREIMLDRNAVHSC